MSFGTIHSLPLDILPPHILGAIKWIAENRGTVISETGNDFLEENDKDEEKHKEDLSRIIDAIRHSSIPDRVEQKVLRKESFYTEIGLSFSEKDKDSFRQELTAIYTKGWTCKAGPQICAFLKEMGLTHTEMNAVAPYMLENVLLGFVSTLGYTRSSTCLNILDNRISALFSLENCGQGLEREDDRVEARVKSFSVSQYAPSSYQCGLTDNPFERLDDLCILLTDPHTPKVVTPRLATCSFSELRPYLPLLKGQHFISQDSAVAYRNARWWEETIRSLLYTQRSTPVLLLYGVAHHTGQTGILQRILDEGFSLMNLTRQGFVPYTSQEHLTPKP